MTRRGLLGLVLDRPRAGDQTVELGDGEFLLVDERLVRAIESFELIRDEVGSLSLRALTAPPRLAASRRAPRPSASEAGPARAARPHEAQPRARRAR